MKVRTRTFDTYRCALAGLVAGLAAASFATLATATPVPAQHFSLMPVGGEPLREGFVEVIHPDGPKIYARHVYQLNGARSSRSYDVVISIWTSSLSCSGAPEFVLPVAVVATNTAGNGQAGVVHDPELVAALGLRGLTIGGNVTLSYEGSAAYTNWMPGGPAGLGRAIPDGRLVQANDARPRGPGVVCIFKWLCTAARSIAKGSSPAGTAPC